ncbi:hypothetical protein MMC15_002904 [Xylographa vitiligo]|nr:hypothetical protein [Xylographa vitiligo]
MPTSTPYDEPTLSQFSSVIICPMAAANPPTLRALYRSILRELPHRPLSAPSPLQQRIRSSFSTVPSTPTSSEYDLLAAEQYVQYARAQRMYATLLERYNPGMGMDEEERVRLTARRVGMDLPEEWRKS